MAQCSHNNNEHTEEFSPLHQIHKPTVEIDAGSIEFDYSMLSTLQDQGSDYTPAHVSNSGRMGKLLRLQGVLTAMSNQADLSPVKLKQKLLFVPPH